VTERSIQIVFSNPYPGKDDEFNEWYDNTHVHEVLAIPGVVSAQRFDLRPLSREAGQEPEYRYVAIYEIEGDPDKVMAKLGAAVKSGAVAMSDTFDRMGSKLAFWTPRGPKTESG
jgi:hypothetical protein